MLRVVVLALVALSLGCSKSKPSQGAPVQQIGGLTGSFGTQTVGPPPYPTSWPGIRTTKLSPDVAAPVGSHAVLEVEVRDDNGALVQGAQVLFTAQVIGSVYGLGTSSTDHAGRAAVTAIPATVGAHLVRVEATTTHAISGVVTFTVTGR